MRKFSIAIDGGHSCFKVRAAYLDAPHPEQRLTFEIPTVVTPAVALSHEPTRLKAVRDTVTLGEVRYFVGETALRQSGAEMYTGQHDDWIHSPQHDALLLAAWRSAMENIGTAPVDVQLVLGLPAKYLVRQRTTLKERVLGLLQPRLATGQSLRVMIHSQAEAPLQWLALRSDGSLDPDRDLDREAWGVVEIGHYTTDFAFCDRGAMVEHAVYSCVGMHRVSDALIHEFAARGLPTALECIERALVERSLVLHGERHDVGHLVDFAAQPFIATVLDEAVRLFGKQASLMHGIVIAGGGASLLITALKARFRSARMSDTPRMTVAEGFCRVGLAALARRAL